MIKKRTVKVMIRRETIRVLTQLDLVRGAGVEVYVMFVDTAAAENGCPLQRA